MKLKILLVLVFVALISVGCADVAQVQFVNPNEHVYGFWGGVWHGMITGPAFIGSLFDDSIAIYAVHNNGIWYNFGFIGGLGILIKAFKGFINIIIRSLSRY